MTISFNIHFHTLWGQSLCVVGSIPELGCWDYRAATKLKYKEDGVWSVEVNIPDKYQSFQYRYFLRSEQEVVLEEWSRAHTLCLPDDVHSLYLLDHWQSPPKDILFYSSAFTKGLFYHPPTEMAGKSTGNDLIIRVWAPFVKKGQRLALYGNQAAWGNWNEPQFFCPTSFPEWEIRLDRQEIGQRVEFKFCILDGEESHWEEGEDRSLLLPYTASRVIVSGLFFRNRAINWKCAGLAIPVFSLRSEESFGIGDFIDLKKMTDWAKLTGLKIIQILPVNDTTTTRTREDSYPYNAISIYALNPMYLNLERLGVLDNPDRRAYYEEKQRELNSLHSIDYDEVCREKWNYFREIYAQDGEKTINSQGYNDFYSKNSDWLPSYIAYSYLRDSFLTADFGKWEEYASYNKEKIEKLIKNNPKETAFFAYIQYHLHLQLAEAKEYASANGIIVKGDIPIGVNRVSIETWKEPYYFNLDFQAGAPPDDFSVAGQNWGFPTYNWQAMENDNYRWWKNRFRKMGDYFDAYRIDHILGFFRIWQIPADSREGLLGYFYPALPFSIEEIESSGLKFRREHFTRPHINRKYLDAMFGEYASEVKQVYLNRIDAENFGLKERVDTQQKINTLFGTKDDKKSYIIREGLFSICNEVLFIRDREMHDYYHPRISATGSLAYNELENQDKYAFDYLYWNYFYNRHNDFWKEQALKHLTPLIKSTEMLACGEDLGMIPHSVPEVMNKLQILSLEIERMPKTHHTEFTELSHLPYLSVCTTSTHDMPTLRGWWKENKERTQRYYNTILKREGEAPGDCTPDICRQIIENHLASSSIFCIIPFQDWLSIDGQLRNPDIESERINIPANPRHYWRYRMHLTIEELLRADGLNRAIGEAVSSEQLAVSS